MSATLIEALCLKAQQAIAQRQWDQAKLFYLQALGHKSDVPDIHYGLATVFFQLRELTSAAHHFREVARLDPHRAGAHVNLGAVLNLLGELDNALAALRKGIQLDPKRVEGYYNLGLVHRRKGQLDLSIQAYREATRVNPRMADAHYNLANLYLDKEQYRQAAESYKHALAVRPGWDKALQGLDGAEQALADAAADREEEEAAARPEPDAVASRPAVPAARVDPNRVVDPDKHGLLLTSLHKATIESENHGRQFLELMQEQIEPVIKELSSCLISPDVSTSVLDACVQKFEAALQHMRSARDNLQASIQRVRSLGDRLVTEAS